MQLCLDATRFGFGLAEAVQLAAENQVSAITYSFAAFAVSNRGARLSTHERAYLQEVRSACQGKGVSIACIILDAVLEVEDKKQESNFQAMLTKLAQLCAELEAPRLSFSVQASNSEKWLAAASACINRAVENCAVCGVKLLLRTGTPTNCRGVSLSRWAPIAPPVWRELLANCPGLALSFSPADCFWQGIDYLALMPTLVPAIEHVEGADVEVIREIIVENGLFGPLWWRYRLPGKGQLDWNHLIEALKLYEFQGNLAIHLDDEFIPDDKIELAYALASSLERMKPLMRG